YYVLEIVCPEVGPIENGQVHGSGLTVGSQVRFTCNGDYSLDGTSVQTCGNNGHWYPTQRPSCQKCGLPITPFNHGSMIVSVENERTKTISYSCDSGYRMKGENTQTCSFSIGLWKPSVAPVCLKTCATPEPPRNGLITSLQNLFHGSRVVYECKDGYELEGLAHQTCANGRWTPSKPECILSTLDSYSFFSSLQ
ncbi:sushi, von Willebrand factor type A, EGF and pentraxin domain-containing protein 1-like, partial [Anneissia japonica]|uniref:sushi, von Willebrand factor type A, EGF and pentraxin domain-containing protein 1-like n=1 Tax=Anneissia japonica TaxID=1529436 RepID=UPI001425A4D7